MAGIAREGGERVGDGVEEQGVDQAGMALGERIESVRQRKDDMEVFDREQVGAAGLEPALLGQGLAFGTVAVAAGVVADLHGAAAITGVPMAAEGGGAARLDGLHGAALSTGQRMSLPIGGAVGAEDLGELHVRPAARARHRRGHHGRGVRRGRAAWAGRAASGCR